MRFFPRALLTACALFTCAFNRVRSFPVRSFPVRFFPVRFFPVRFFPVRSFPVCFFPVRFFPVRFFPVRFFPVRSFPVCFFPVRFFPVRFFPVRFFPVRSFPVCFFPVRFFPVSLFPITQNSNLQKYRVPVTSALSYPNYWETNRWKRSHSWLLRTVISHLKRNTCEISWIKAKTFVSRCSCSLLSKYPQKGGHSDSSNQLAGKKLPNKVLLILFKRVLFPLLLYFPTLKPPSRSRALIYAGRFTCFCLR